MANESDITVIRGDTLALTGQVTTQPAGTGFDLTGYSIIFAVKATLDEDDTDAAALIKETVTSSNDWANGYYTINLTTTDTKIAEGTYYYNIRVKKNDSTSITSTKNGLFKIVLGAVQG